MNSRVTASEDLDRLLGQVATEFFERLSRGESPQIDEYVERHPQIAEMIRQAFPALEMVNESVVGEAAPAHAPSSSNEQRLGDFRILGELGRGGMGVVYEAEQLSMGGRRVALKVLPFAAMVDQKRLQRFHNEVRAAASLDHPHIVSVYSVGEERGVHFYAMQLIRGQSMATVIEHLRELRQADCPSSTIKEVLSASFRSDQQPIEYEPTQDLGTREGAAGPSGQDSTMTREAQALVSTEGGRSRSPFFASVAQLGIQAAQALHHAHEQGVVHRDIKPANLMLDATAKLFVTDFGLAQMEDDVGVTMTGDLIGTLRYMSPEQALGKRVHIDHRADIYSLGVTLYELLTMRPAFDGDNREALLRQIAFEEPRRLRTLDRSIPQDLETILHKAIAKNPDERYSSAQELADDLCAFGERRPIVARRPSLVDRTHKWVLRHQGFVAAATIIMLLTTIGLAISNAMIARQREVAENQRDAAEHLRKEADEQRLQAERSFRLAFDAVDQMLTEVANEDLKNIPRAEPTRRALLEKAAAFFQELLGQREDDPVLRRETALAFMRAGDVLSLLDQHLEAEQSYREAIAQFRKLATGSSRQPDDEHNLAKCYFQLAELLGKLDRVEEQERLLEDALEIEKRLVAQVPGEPSFRSHLAMCYASLGRVKATFGGSAAAQTFYEQGQALLPTSNGNDASVAFAVREGMAEYGSWPELMRVYQESLTTWEGLCEEFPENPQYQERRALCLVDMFAIHMEQGDSNAAKAYGHQAVARSRELVKDFTSVPRYRAGLATALARLSDQLAGQERHKAVEESLDIFTQLKEQFPNVPDYSRGQAKSLHQMANSYEAGGELGEAMKCFRRSLDVRKQLAARFTETQSDVFEVARTEWTLGTALWGAGRYTEAEQLLRDSIIKYRELSDGQTASVLGSLAGLLYEQGRMPEADRVFRESLSLFNELTTEEPEKLHSHLRHFRRKFLGEYAELLVSANRHHEVVAVCQEAMNAAMNGLKTHPQASVKSLARWFDTCTEVVLTTDLQPQIETYFRECLEGFEQLRTQRKDDPDCLTQQLRLQCRYLEWITKSGERTEAEDSFRQATTLFRDSSTNSGLNLDAVMIFRSLHLDSLRAGDGVGPHETSFRRAFADHLEPLLQSVRKSAHSELQNEAVWKTWGDLAFAYYLARDWEGAESEAESVVDIAGGDPVRVFHIAPLLLLANKPEKYQQVCRQLLDVAQHSVAPAHLGTLVRLCGLDAACAGEPARVLRIAERNVEEAQAQGDSLDISHYALGRILYRCGNYDAAVDYLTQALEKTSPVRETIICADLALAHYYWGKPQEAQVWLNKAIHLMSETPLWGHAAMQVEVLLHEAQRVFGGKAAPDSQPL